MHAAAAAVFAILLSVDATTQAQAPDPKTSPGHGMLTPETHGWSPASYPNPLTNFTLCGRPAPSHVCDPDHVISQFAANVVNLFLKKHDCSLAAL